MGVALQGECGEGVARVLCALLAELPREDQAPQHVQALDVEEVGDVEVAIGGQPLDECRVGSAAASTSMSAEVSRTITDGCVLPARPPGWRPSAHRPTGPRPPAAHRPPEAAPPRATPMQCASAAHCFNSLKQWRGIATRYCKTATNYLGGLHLRAIVIWATP